MVLEKMDKWIDTCGVEDMGGAEEWVVVERGEGAGVERKGKQEGKEKEEGEGSRDSGKCAVHTV